MPIFEVMINVTTTYSGKILVEAENLDGALEYCNKNHEWHDDAMEDGIDYTTSFQPAGVNIVSNLNELPSGYTATSLPWNGDGNTALGDLLIE